MQRRRLVRLAERLTQTPLDAMMQSALQVPRLLPPQPPLRSPARRAGRCCEQAAASTAGTCGRMIVESAGVLQVATSTTGTLGAAAELIVAPNRGGKLQGGFV